MEFEITPLERKPEEKYNVSEDFRCSPTSIIY